MTSLTPLFSLAVACLLMPVLQAQETATAHGDHWLEHPEEHGITLFVKHDHEGAREHKATATLTASFKEVSNQLTDVSSFSDWLYGFPSLTVLGQDADGSTNIYLKSVPDAAGNAQDIAANVIVTKTETMCVCRITGRPDMVPAVEGYARIPVFSGFVIVKKEGSECKVTFHTEIGLGGTGDQARAEYEARELTLQSLQALQRTLSGGVAREGR